MKVNLGVRLFISHILVIAVAMTVLVLVTQFALPSAYGRHLGIMEGAIPSETGLGMGSGHTPGQGDPGRTGLFASFRTSFNEALFIAGFIAMVLALIVSMVISRRLAKPIHAMTVASQRISEGHYNERVPPGGGDELGNLAGSFNRMAEKLEQTETMRRQLIGDVSHELRTPLTTIQGSMEGLIDGILPANTDTYEQIHREAGRLTRLVDDLQELSRVEAGGFSLEFKPVSIKAIVDSTYARYSPQFTDKEVKLINLLPDNLPAIMADEDRVEQVLLNLIGNGLQHTPRGGEVTISAEVQDRELFISVADTGIGIPAKHLPHIFDRFYRVDPSRSRQKGGGSGIGLTIALRLVEAHGGHIWAESAGENCGSTFTFTLPLAGE